MATREQVGAWRALADAATPGPWEPYDCGEDEDYDLLPFVVCSTSADEGVQLAESAPPGDVNGDDEPFIAASREAVPVMADMLAEVFDALEYEERHYGLGTHLYHLLCQWRGEEDTTMDAPVVRRRRTDG